VVLTNEMLGSAAIDNLVAFATTWDGGMKKHWIVYNIHAMTAKDLELLAQELAPKLEVDRVVVLRALLAMVSLRKAGWQEPSASSLSGTHAGMYDYARLCSFVDPKLELEEPDKIDGFVLNTGLLWGDLKQGGFLAEILELAKYLRMELSAPAMGLVHCADRSEAAELLVRTWPHLDSLLSSGVRMVPRYLVDELRKEQHFEPAVVSSIMTADGWLALMSVAKYRLFSAAKYRLFSADDVRKIMNSGEFEAIMAEYNVHGVVGTAGVSVPS